MLRSMTGFGRVAVTRDEAHFTVEIKTLNSKYTDVNLRFPGYFRPFEHELRNAVSQALGRGKIEVTITVEGVAVPSQQINLALARAYLRQLQPLVQELSTPTDLLGHVLRIQDVITPGDAEPDPALWQQIMQGVQTSLDAVNEFRTREGAILAADFRGHIESIMLHLEAVDQLDPERISRLRNRLEEQLKEWVGTDQVDRNRFEEELIYYLEKLDISEEKVRLRSHCDYFLELLDSEDWHVGKQLNFLSQEIGREINTIGSKAQHAAMQRHVVHMKDDLEKIKEQVLNVV